MIRVRLLRLFATALVALVFVVPGVAAPRMVTAAPSAPPIHHVFLIVLENQSYNNTFGTTLPVPYLSQTAAAQGALLQEYYGTSHFSLGNYLSIISGQAVTKANQDDCAVSAQYPALSTHYRDIDVLGIAPFGQVHGEGCVYPHATLTLADQLTTAGLTWKGYMEDMGNDSTREAAACGQPVNGIGGPDNTLSAQVAPGYAMGGKNAITDQYAARHNPFVYFHSVLDSGACAKFVEPLNDSTLPHDLQTIATTPNFSFITPNLCDDGHDVPCKSPGSPAGLRAYDPENAFLQKWIPIITRSPAFQADGLLIVTFDESSLSGTSASNVYVGYDGSGCCNEPSGPNTTTPGFPPAAGPGYFNIPITTGPNGVSGGGRIGAVLLSPFIAHGTVSARQYNHYGLLRTLEDLFGVSATQGYLGYAGYPDTVPFGRDIWTSTKAPTKIML
jgi:hypothetical protein